MAEEQQRVPVLVLVRPPPRQRVPLRQVPEQAREQEQEPEQRQQEGVPPVRAPGPVDFAQVLRSRMQA